MSALSGSFRESNLTEVLRIIVSQRQTGMLRLQDGDQEGFVAIENGVILCARTAVASGLNALFQFVGWREGKFELKESPIQVDLPRDLADYDPQVLITGIAFKVDELTLLSEAIPPLDSVVTYTGNGNLSALEDGSSDRSLIQLADGHRTVREIAEEVKSSPSEVARSLARFRLAGMLKVSPPKKLSAKAARAAVLAAAH